jgi:hypothetical protein
MDLDSAVDWIVAGAVAMQIFNGVEIVGPVSVADLALLVALISVAGYQLVIPDGWLSAAVRPFGILFGGLWLWLTLAGSGFRTTQFGAFALIAMLVMLYCRDLEDVETLLLGALAGATLAAVLTLYSTFVDPSFGGRTPRPRGIGPLPRITRSLGIPIGSFGAFATYVLAPVGWAITRYRRTRDWRLLAAVAAIVVMVVVLQSRATYLALVMLTTILVVGLYGRRLWIGAFRNVGVSVMVLVAGAATATITGWVLLTTNVSTVLSRFAQFDRAILLILQHPLTGVTPPIEPFFPITGVIPHNVVLIVGVVGGLPAVALLLATFSVAAVGLWYACHDPDPRVRAVSLGIAAGWAATLTNLSLAPGFTRAFWLLVTLGIVLLRRDGTHLTGIGVMPVAVSNSRLTRAVNWAIDNTATRATMDVSETRRKVEQAYRASTTRLLAANLRRTVKHSYVVGLIVGSDNS